MLVLVRSSLLASAFRSLIEPLVPSAIKLGRMVDARAVLIDDGKSQ